VPCFCAKIRLSGKIPENTTKFLFYQKTHGARIRDGGGHEGLTPPGGVGQAAPGVVGMTFGVCQGQRYLPAGVPGISMALSQEDRLCPKGRLRQQPAGDSTEESQSRRRQQDPPNDCFAESSLDPTRSTGAGDGRDASHARAQPISGQEPSP
jgi:hypothetical protein